MSDLDIRFYLSILWRRLPYLLAIAPLAIAIAVAIALSLPPVYRASAKILIEAPQIPADLARSTVPTGAVEQLRILQQRITTRDALIDLATRFNIYGKSEKEPSADDIVKDMRARVKFEQVSLDAFNPVQEATIFNVSFDADTPTMAADVANELAASILSRNLRLRTDRAGNTLQFFNNEVTRLGTDLNRLEAEILAFKTKNKDTLPDSLDFRRSQQSSQQERLIALEREETDLRSRRSSLVATYAATGQLSDSGPLTPEQQMLADLNRALAEQLAIFSENSPNITAIRARIAALQNGMNSNDQKGKDKGGKRSGTVGLELQLSEIDERLQFIVHEKSSITQRIANLTASITATPASETVLNALERNRVNIQNQYNTAIARRADASIGEQIEMRADGGRISLLEAATPPQSKESPKRGRIVAMGGAGGIGLSLALVALLEILNKTIRRPAELVRRLQMQPLATIPYIWTAAELRAARTRRNLAVLSAGAIPATLILIHYYYMPLNLALQKIVTGIGSVGTM
ncbi:Wzz/FepE/Etk N-terminal domain-containing protein [Sinorhizobium sp. BG8]|uniref:GumC family protein n=1 Tax=Sinorhizobium sp. BG8 TaxID=2613773 RepID=UPI00193E7047|nr:Wzz/FepE/Etk N-terminal domain-containing protein [Sinorhizobium sp. BG8]QRM57745.1 lipopolysaccharide biosynthesis protein [Sinorhizobium sp. BG8]